MSHPRWGNKLLPFVDFAEGWVWIPNTCLSTGGDRSTPEVSIKSRGEQEAQDILYPLSARAGHEQRPFCCISCNVRPFSLRFLQTLSLVVPEDLTREVEESQREVVNGQQVHLLSPGHPWLLHILSGFSMSFFH